MIKGKILKVTTILGTFISVVALSSCTTAETNGGGLSYIPLIAILALVIIMFYFLMVRPMRQREKKHDQMVNELQRGDTVITAGGIYGQIESIQEDGVILKVESGAMIKVTKGGILSTQPK